MSEQNTVPCPNCGHFNRVGARFCGRCSQSLVQAAPPPQPQASALSTPVAYSPAPQVHPGSTPQPSSINYVTPAAPQEQIETRFCPKCGQAVTPGTNFCRHCGCDLAVTPSITSASSPPAAPFPAMPSSHPIGVGMVGMSTPTPPALPQPVTPIRRTRHVNIPGWGWLLIGLLLGILLSIAVIMFTPIDPATWLEPAAPSTQVTPAAEETVPADGGTPTPEPISTPAP